MTGRLEIDRVPLTFVAATTPARAERVSRLVRDAVASSLPGALASACGSALDEGDAYVFIDRLSVECAVAAHWEDEAIGRAFAARVASALVRDMSAAATIRFRDRPEYLAAFVTALADGHAFSRWWFDEFDGLAALPVSAALRTLVLNEGAAGVRALARLTTETRRRVLGVLTPADGRRLLHALLPDGADARASVHAPALIAALHADGLRAAVDPVQRDLACLVALERYAGGAVTRSDVAALAVLAALEHAAREGRLAGDLALAAHADAVLTRCGGRLDIPLDQIAALAARGAVAIVEHLRTIARASASSPVVRAPDGAFTANGGAVVLCALLARLGWWHSWHDAIGARAAAWLALDVAARALALRTARRVTRDPVVRALLGVEGHRVGLRRRLTALGTLSTVDAAAAALLAEFARRVPGCDSSTAAYLRTRCLTFPAMVAARDERIDARLGRSPLDVVVRMSGLTRLSVELPGGRVLAVSEDGS
jgi:hypothetical protein